MKTFLVTFFAATLALFACSAPAPKTAAAFSVTAQAEARGAVTLAETVWNVAAEACVEASQANVALLPQCQTTLLPARDELVAAAGLVDSWQAGNEGKIGCAAQSALAAVVQVAPLLKLAPADVQALVDAQALARALGSCSPVDAGGQ